MPRPRGRHKTARLTVNLEDTVFSSLLTLARQQDAAVAWVARRAIVELIARELPKIEQPNLPLQHTGAVPRTQTP